METVERHSLRWLARTLGVPRELLSLLASDPDGHYRPFVVHPQGKKPRLIDNPDPILKFVQRQLRKRVLACVDLPDHVHGCVQGRSPLSNASVHSGQCKVVSIDVKNFYPSVTNRVIYDRFRRLGWGPKLASVATKLTTLHGHLPQGAPTSDALGNQILVPVDEVIQILGRQLGLHASRYLDNIDLSGEWAHAAIPLVIAALRRQGLAVRHKKTFSAGPRQAHVVTGYTVNNPGGPSISRREQRRIRSAVHELIVADQAGHRTEHLRQSVRGRLAHVRRTNPGPACRLDRQLNAAGIFPR